MSTDTPPPKRWQFSLAQIAEAFFYFGLGCAMVQSALSILHNVPPSWMWLITDKLINSDLRELFMYCFSLLWFLAMGAAFGASVGVLVLRRYRGAMIGSGCSAAVLVGILLLVS